MPALQVYPVIHHRDPVLTLSEIDLARHFGADGVFVISHDGKDRELLHVAHHAQRQDATFPIGINLLSMPAMDAGMEAIHAGLKMLWADDMGVSSAGLTDMGKRVSRMLPNHIQCFAGVAFKYQPREPDPVGAARQAVRAGLIPTTSGIGTGHAPPPGKVREMGAVGPLAVASGMTPGNIAAYAAHLGYVLVATGIALDEHRMDPKKLKVFLERARGSHAAADAPPLGS